jgi:Tfp pilus assembly protein PilF
VQILASYYELIELHPEMKEQAFEMAKLLIEAHPDEFRVYAVYGDFLIRDKQFKEAREQYRMAQKLGAKDFNVMQQILRLDAQQLEWDVLYRDSEEAISLFPDQPMSYFFAGIALSQQKKYSEAVKLLQQGLKMVVDDKELEGQFYTSLGDAYQELKEYAKSEENYEKALEINPKDATVLNNYAYFLSLRNDRLDKAEEMSRLSNEIQPKQSSFEDTYGWIMYKQGKYKEAKEWIEKSMENGAATSGTVLEHYGDVLYRLGDHSKAYEYWQKAKDAGDTSDMLEKKLSERKLYE